MYVNPQTGGAGGGDPLQEIVVTAQRIPTDEDEDELPEAKGRAMGGEISSGPSAADRQVAVTRMLARRAAMINQAAMAQMPQNAALGPQQLPQQAMGSPMAPQMPMPVNAPVGMMPQGQPLMPQMQAPQGPSPMQAGIMGAPQLRGGF